MLMATELHVARLLGVLCDRRELLFAESDLAKSISQFAPQ